MMLFAAAALAAPGDISTVAGTGVQGSGGDGGPATSAQLRFPTGVAATADGGFLIADRDSHRVRKVTANGTITTVAGTGTACLPVTSACSDGGPATSAQLNTPVGIAATADGGFLIAVAVNQRIRKVSADGTITDRGRYGKPWLHR